MLKFLQMAILVSCMGLSKAANVDDYITYLPGTLPIILTAPHGGYLAPADIPDRTAGCFIGGSCVWTHTCGQTNPDECPAKTIPDKYTRELTILIRNELYQIYGAYPHVIINELKRSKLDANREKDEAALGVPIAEMAWELFHSNINVAKAAINGPSLLIDIHGHGHDLQWAEIAYLISSTRLNNGNFYAKYTSIRSLAGTVNMPFDELVRGNYSFGSILEYQGYDAVPSVSKPSPGNNPYFMGGTDLKMHGSKYGGLTDAIQVESARTFRWDANKRGPYAKAFAKTIAIYMGLYYGLPVTGK